MLWYHSRAHPTTKYYVHNIQPVVHNYGLTLALAGYIVDPDVGYASIFNHTKYKEPIKLYQKYGVYAYPAIVAKAVLSEILMAAQNEGIVTLRGRPRLAYPFFTKNVVLMPGSILRTLVVSRRELPKRIATRIGAKRSGVLRVHLTPVRVSIEEWQRVTHPFNLKDVVRVEGYSILLDHGAGQIASFGVAERSLVYKMKRGSREQVVVLPSLKEVE